MITQNDIRAILRHRCEASGSQKQWAIANNIGTGFVNDVLTGRREPSARLSKALGYEKTVHFIPCNTQHDGA